MPITVEDIKIERYHPEAGDCLICYLPEWADNQALQEVHDLVQQRVGNDVSILCVTEPNRVEVLRRGEPVPEGAIPEKEGRNA